MDAPEVDRAALSAALGYLRWVNRRMGGAAALIARLSDWSRTWTPGRPVTLLDIATGSADIPIAVRAWALSRGHDVRITAVDLHDTTLDLAREHVAEASRRDPRLGEGITLERADALKLADRFKPASFDYVHAALFLHHLPDVPALTVLAVMHKLCAHGLVWSDLHRSWFQRAAVSLAASGAGPIVRHDARVSVEAGFTKAEALDMARRVGIERPRYRRPPLWYRFTLTGEKRTFGS